jgi:hypothetical protein
MLAVVPLLNLLSTWPPRPDLVEWRIEQFGVLVNALPPATLGLALSLYIARASEHRRTLGLLGVVALLASMLLLFLLGSFGLDAAQLSARIQPGEKTRYAVTVLRLLLQTGVVLAALTVLGVMGLRVRRRERREVQAAPSLRASSPC